VAVLSPCVGEMATNRDLNYSMTDASLPHAARPRVCGLDDSGPKSSFARRISKEYPLPARLTSLNWLLIASVYASVILAADSLADFRDASACLVKRD
jgi:hypothetical protein